MATRLVRRASCRRFHDAIAGGIVALRSLDEMTLLAKPGKRCTRCVWRPAGRLSQLRQHGAGVAFQRGDDDSALRYEREMCCRSGCSNIVVRLGHGGSSIGRAAPCRSQQPQPRPMPSAGGRRRVIRAAIQCGRTGALLAGEVEWIMQVMDQQIRQCLAPAKLMADQGRETSNVCRIFGNAPPLRFENRKQRLSVCENPVFLVIRRDKQRGCAKPIAMQ